MNYKQRRIYHEKPAKKTGGQVPQESASGDASHISRNKLDRKKRRDWSGCSNLPNKKGANGCSPLFLKQYLLFQFDEFERLFSVVSYEVDTLLYVFAIIVFTVPCDISGSA